MLSARGSPFAANHNSSQQPISARQANSTQLRIRRVTALTDRHWQGAKLYVAVARVFVHSITVAPATYVCNACTSPFLLPSISHRTPRQSRVSCSSTAEADLVTEQQLIFRTASSTSDLQQAATLRAEAYYEVLPPRRSFFVCTKQNTEAPCYCISFCNAVHVTVDNAGDACSTLRWQHCLQEQPHARYVNSFKRQFIDQTLRLLRQQTARSLNALLPECVCLVAMLPGTKHILATCDIQPPKCAAGQHPKAVPPHDKHAAYVTNVAVDSKSRGQGLGFQLLEAAAAFALEEWQAQAVYTTVDSANKVDILCHLYTIHAELLSRVCKTAAACCCRQPQNYTPSADLRRPPAHKTQGVAQVRHANYSQDEVSMSLKSNHSVHTWVVALQRVTLYQCDCADICTHGDVLMHATQLYMPGHACYISILC